MLPIILSGGTGKRLWPMSRQSCPKQFLALASYKTLFQDTVIRCNKLGLEAPIITASIDQRFLIAQNIKDINYKAQTIILEPLSKNTAPAITSAVIHASHISGPDTIIVTFPSDHKITDLKKLQSSLQIAEKLAQNDHIVSFGIAPSTAHTGYGYIEIGAPMGDNAFKINSFSEKPDVSMANQFLNSGRYLWNSGIYCFKVATFLDDMKTYSPHIVDLATGAYLKGKQAPDFYYLENTSYEHCSSISIDHALMEHTTKGAMVHLDAGWSDIGDWEAVWKISNKDNQNNVLNGDVSISNSNNNIIFSQNQHISVYGVDDLIVINTGDAILIADKNKADEIKNITEELENKKRHELL